MTALAEMEELGIEECRELLASNSYGRLGVVVEGQPMIFPVNYVFDGETVVFLTNEGTKLVGADYARVAFEVDEVDAGGRNGWSVMVLGTAYDITTARHLRAERLQQLQVHSALRGSHDRMVEIFVKQMSGRRLLAQRDISNPSGTATLTDEGSVS